MQEQQYKEKKWSIFTMNLGTVRMKLVVNMVMVTSSRRGPDKARWNISCLSLKSESMTKLKNINYGFSNSKTQKQSIPYKIWK